MDAWWIDLIKYVVTALCGGGLAGILTFRITKRKLNAEAKKMEAEAKGEQVGLVERLEERIVELLKAIADRDAIIQRKTEEAATKGMCMCVHFGCKVRHPAYGRGAIYYDQHKDEVDFGVDYIPIEDLLARQKRKEHKEQTIMKVKSDEDK